MFRGLFNWFFELLYRMLEGLLYLVGYLERIFNVFAGTEKITYYNQKNYLINVFFQQDVVSNVFWAMALISMVLTLAFAIVAVARKTVDVTGHVKQSVGQIMSNLARAFLTIFLCSACTLAAIQVSNVLLDRINYAFENAYSLGSGSTRSFSDREYAVMVRVLNTVANYALNPAPDQRYNINTCYNEIREDLLELNDAGMFRYSYEPVNGTHYSWQGALALIAGSGDLTQDLSLEEYNADVSSAVTTVMKEVRYNPNFRPQETVTRQTVKAASTDVLLFLTVGMDAANSGIYNQNPSFTDGLRVNYYNGVRSYHDLGQVESDFDIWQINYVTGYISALLFLFMMGICIFIFIVRLFNLVLLYLVAPLFVSSMPLDDGAKFQSWTQAFVIQLFTGYGAVITMRMYLLLVPIILSDKLVFFKENGLNTFCRLLFILGGIFAVMKGNSLITSVVAGNSAMHSMESEGAASRIMHMGIGAAMGSTRSLLGGAKSSAKTLIHARRNIRDSRNHKFDSDRKAEERKAYKKSGGKSPADVPKKEGSTSATNPAGKPAGKPAGQPTPPAGQSGQSPTARPRPVQRPDPLRDE